MKNSKNEAYRVSSKGASHLKKVEANWSTSMKVSMGIAPAAEHWSPNLSGHGSTGLPQCKMPMTSSANVLPFNGSQPSLARMS
jgi:ribosomal protein L21E